VQNTLVRYSDVSPDQTRIVFCGESYSPQNFVDRTIQAYMMMVNSTDGSYIWGKYYQNNVANATDYMGLFYSCKFVSDQKLIISGQVNFFKPFIGVMNASDGTFIEGTLFSSTEAK
jgi:hypothetical protein